MRSDNKMYNIDLNECKQYQIIAPITITKGINIIVHETGAVNDTIYKTWT